MAQLDPAGPYFLALLVKAGALNGKTSQATEESMRSRVLWLAFVLLAVAIAGFAQNESATLSGRVTDSTGAVLPNASVTVIDQATKIERHTISNNVGLYVVPGLKPGVYRIIVKRAGFSQFVKTDIVLHVQDSVAENFELRVGSVSESVTVSAMRTATEVNTTESSVGTVIDQKFVSNIPLNGRTLETLIMLAPGVALTPTNYSSDPSSGDQGQFSVNGQRANANIFTVDGVSGNFGVTTQVAFTQSVSGSLPATNNQGSFSSLVSADALEEFKIQTSTSAPEFGRSPGGQISLVTRSGTNQFHGSVFEYLRNDIADSKDWFDIKKPALRFNDFGASLGGPIWRNKTFFFFAYEGQRFVLPQPTLPTPVPSQAVRDAAPNPTAKALLDAFPVPNGPVIPGTDGAIYQVGYSLPNSSDSYSIRVDHTFNSRFSLFGRYNQAPSNSFTRNRADLSQGTLSDTNTKTLTFGSNQMLTKSLLNEVRLNGSMQRSTAVSQFDGFGGGKQPDPSLFLANLPLSNAFYSYFIFSVIQPDGTVAGLNEGAQGSAKARSINFVDTLSYVKGKHSMKFGFDYRWYSPVSPALSASILDAFFSAQDVYNLTAPIQVVGNGAKTDVIAPNYSIYAQDTWKMNPRLTLTYGLRWEINPPPHIAGGRQSVTLSAPPDLSNFDQSGLQLAPLGTPYYHTQFNKFAPRVGADYEINRTPGHELVVRGGWGLFYDFNSTPFASSDWPYTQGSFGFGAFPIPVPASTFDFPPPNFTPSPTNLATVDVAGRGYTLPRTHEWNLTFEQGLGADQTLTLGYVGSAGRKLLRSLSIDMVQTPTPNVYYSPNFTSLRYADNAAKSDYHSLQAQFRRRLAKGLQIIANYTWSHSTDDVSTTQSFFSPGFIYDPSVNHGASTFDIRHNFTTAFYYQIPTPKWNAMAGHILGNWSLSGLFMARTGTPFNIQMSEPDALGNITYARRPDVVPGVPLIIHDSQAPGGWKVNNAVDASGNPLAFKAPASPFAQGDMGRDSIRGFNAWQSDIGLHREFGIKERIKAEFRVEAFNIFNHPNFANPYAYAQYAGGQWTLPNTLPFVFGQSNQTAARGYNGGTGLNPLFQVGGPRSMQLALRVSF